MMQSQKLKTALFAALMLAILGGALALRLPSLSQRPMHTDEAIHADKLCTLLNSGRYIYNPYEYHGPTIYYFALPILWLSGAHTSGDIQSETPLRLVPALFGAGLIVLLLLIGDGLGWRAVLAAAALTALSPAMVFYSRYYIQEMLLVFFTFAAIAAAWRYTRHLHFAWALLAGLFLGLMHATKETSVIAYGAMGGAALLTMLWSRQVDGHKLRLRKYWRHWHVGGTVTVSVAVAVLFLTAFLSNPKATFAIVRSMLVYIGRGGTGDSSTNGAAVHNHPWFYYLKMLSYYHNAAGPWWSEGLILLLALAGIIFALRPRDARLGANLSLARFLAFYTILLTTIYSVIPYKTPWCLVSFLHGMILMAGLGAANLWRRAPGWAGRAVLAALLLAGAWNLGAQAWRGAIKFSADPRNPYVYAHTTPNLLKMVKRIQDIAQISPTGDKTVIKAIVPNADYWPLPWYLRHFRYVGFYGAMPDEPDAPLIIAGPTVQEAIENKQRDCYMVEYYGLRPDVLLTLMIRNDLWEKYLATQAKPK